MLVRATKLKSIIVYGSGETNPFTISFWGFHTDHRTHPRTTSWLHNFLMISPQSCTPQPFPLLCRYFHPQKIQRVLNTEVSKSISIASQNNLGGKKILIEYILWPWVLAVSQQPSAVALEACMAILRVERGQGNTPLTMTLKDSPRC